MDIMLTLTLSCINWKNFVEDNLHFSKEQVYSIKRTAQKMKTKLCILQLHSRQEKRSTLLLFSIKYYT
jgi:hypothetical protein